MKYGTAINEMISPNIITAYRIVECKDSHPYTLFHAIPNTSKKRSRKIPIEEWLRAENKMVKDGTSKSEYLSGFNVLLNLKHMKEYTKRFTAPRTLKIIKIFVRPPLRPKEHSKSDVWLADWMFIPKNWKKSAINIRG